MRSQFLPLLRNEITKAARRKLPYFGIFALGLLATLIYFVGGRLTNTTGANAWGYIAFSMQCLFADIGPLFVIVFSGMLLSEETGTGTIRAALAAPVQRWELYAAKAVTGLSYTLLLSLAGLAFSIALAKIHYQFADIGDSFGIVYSRGTAVRQFLLGYALSWIPLVALVMYGLFISTVIRSPGAAVAVGISTVFLIDFTKHLVGLDPYIFTKYIGYSWTTLNQLAHGMEFQWQPDVWRMLLVSGACAAVTFGLGLTIFVKEDLNR